MKKSTILKSLLLLFTTSLLASEPEHPNLVVIMTDEHNFRTLSCYRDLMTDDQAYVWGEGVEVKTPHIDRIAKEGAICMNYYASSPVCTPSRASFVSGLYPQATDSYKNDIPLNDNVVTFAQVLKDEGYATSYVGKWHLDGDAKPGFAPERQFGFSDNEYMFNRGHWKMIKDTQDVPVVSEAGKSKTADETSFTTDYLTTKAMDIIKRDMDKPFCMMLSLPDPHGPNMVREPYARMYKDMTFSHPKTMLVDDATQPLWSISKKEVVTSYNQNKMQIYFGMVKCIDDNMGRLFAFLEDNDLMDNTIVVFTSDHGDLMGEHKRHNKGVPYEASARVPFVLRYPGTVPSGKVIRKAFNNSDFAPTILGLMGASAIPNIHGVDASADFTSSELSVVDDRKMYITGTASNWVAAIDNRYKLVLSVTDEPWLYDLQEDPDELKNFYMTSGYESISEDMHTFLVKSLKKYNDRALIKNKLKYGSF